MTYNVFSGTLNPTHFTSLQFPLALETVDQMLQYKKMNRTTLHTLAEGILI